MNAQYEDEVGLEWCGRGWGLQDTQFGMARSLGHRRNAC